MTLNLAALETGSGSAFEIQLQNVPNNLTDRNITDFYQTCLNLLENPQISRVTQVRIVDSLITAISSSQSNLESFIECGFQEKLPYKKSYLMEQLLDIIYLLACYAPHGITHRTSQLFSHLIPRFTRKCLTIISIYAERFRIILDPWPLLDLLYTHHFYFVTNGSCLSDYLSILVYLNSNSPDYREARQQHSWEAISNIIQTLSDSSDLNLAVLCECYYSLCHIYEGNQKIISYYNFPSSAPKQLTQIPELQNPILSLLMRVPPNGCADDMIKSLVQLIKTGRNENAAIALARIAENRICAHILAKDLFWILPFGQHHLDVTFRVLLTLLNNPPTRRLVTNSVDQLVPFLSLLLDNRTENNEGLRAVCSIIQLIHIDMRIINDLSSTGFLTKFFEVALSASLNDPVALRSTLHATESLARKGDAVEYIPHPCAFVANLVKNDEEHKKEAVRAAVYLAQHPRCCREFKRLELNDYFALLVENEDDPLNQAFVNNYNRAILKPVHSPLASKRIYSRAMPVKTRSPRKSRGADNVITPNRNRTSLNNSFQSPNE